MTDLPFPKGFVLTTRLGTHPQHYLQGPLPGLSISPDTLTESAGNTETGFVVILGSCINVDGEEASAEFLLSKLQSGEDAFFSALDQMVGRHAIIYGDRSTMKIVTDATGMRPVFYAQNGGVAASHALLVERALGGNIERHNMPFWYGHPGNTTPYRRTKLLTPNTLYDLAENTVHRFWPRGPIAERTVACVAHEILGKASNAVRAMSVQMPMKLALTSGLDSRAMLAVMLHSGIDFETYTYGVGEDTRIDRALAPELASNFGVSHTTITTRQPHRVLRDRLREAHYAVHHQSAVAPLAQWIGDDRTAAVTANLLEIGRTFFQVQKRSGAAPPCAAETMAALHYRVTPRRGKAVIAEWGQDNYDQCANTAFEMMLSDTDFSTAVNRVDPFDLFYWEHRMSAWHGASMVERDFYAEPFIPFNGRGVFEAMLGVPEKQRNTADTLHELIRLVEPRLHDLPINPEEWLPEG